MDSRCIVDSRCSMSEAARIGLTGLTEPLRERWLLVGFVGFFGDWLRAAAVFERDEGSVAILL